uniref:Uncharacterized protein LOC102801169 n=1 Tax=Saccoglossus kowalevskii TaxID=10224 RepID=A0ABM0MEU9_SACKO
MANQVEFPELAPTAKEKENPEGDIVGETNQSCLTLLDLANIASKSADLDTPTEKRVPVVTKERSTPNGQKKPATDTPIKSEVRTPKLLTPKLKSSTTPLRKKVPLFSILEDKSLLVPASPYQYTKDDVMEDRKRAEERVKRMMEGVEEPQNKQN